MVYLKLIIVFFAVFSFSTGNADWENSIFNPKKFMYLSGSAEEENIKAQLRANNLEELQNIYNQMTSLSQKQSYDFMDTNSFTDLKNRLENLIKKSQQEKDSIENLGLVGRLHDVFIPRIQNKIVQQDQTVVIGASTSLPDYKVSPKTDDANTLPPGPTRERDAPATKLQVQNSAQTTTGVAVPNGPALDTTADPQATSTGPAIPAAGAPAVGAPTPPATSPQTPAGDQQKATLLASLETDINHFDEWSKDPKFAEYKGDFEKLRDSFIKIREALSKQDANVVDLQKKFQELRGQYDNVVKNQSMKPEDFHGMSSGVADNVAKMGTSTTTVDGGTAGSSSSALHSTAGTASSSGDTHTGNPAPTSTTTVDHSSTGTASSAGSSRPGRENSVGISSDKPKVLFRSGIDGLYQMLKSPITAGLNKRISKDFRVKRIIGHSNQLKDNDSLSNAYKEMIQNFLRAQKNNGSTEDLLASAVYNIIMINGLNNGKGGLIHMRTLSKFLNDVRVGESNTQDIEQLERVVEEVLSQDPRYAKLKAQGINFEGIVENKSKQIIQAALVQAEVELTNNENNQDYMARAKKMVNEKEMMSFESNTRVINSRINAYEAAIEKVAGYIPAAEPQKRLVQLLDEANKYQAGNNQIVASDDSSGRVAGSTMIGDEAASGSQVRQYTSQTGSRVSQNK